MLKNVGTIDRAIRIVAAIGLFSLAFFLEGNLRFIGLLGIVPLATGALSFCPLYRIFGLSTCPVDSSKDKRVTT